MTDDALETFLLDVACLGSVNMTLAAQDLVAELRRHRKIVELLRVQAELSAKVEEDESYAEAWVEAAMAAEEAVLR